TGGIALYLVPGKLAQAVALGSGLSKFSGQLPSNGEGFGLAANHMRLLGGQGQTLLCRCFGQSSALSNPIIHTALFSMTKNGRDRRSFQHLRPGSRQSVRANKEHHIPCQGDATTCASPWPHSDQRARSHCT